MMRINPEYHYRNMRIELPYDYQHRCIKLLLGSGRWFKVWRMRSAEELRSKLLVHLPAAAYISTSTYLDPLHVSLKWKTQRRGEYKVRQNTLMTSDFVPDFDDRYYDTALKKYVATDPKEDVQKAYWYLKGIAGFDGFKFTNTNRGYHLWVLDFYGKRCHGRGPTRSHERELFILHEKKKLADELLQHGVHFDYNVTVDTRRVVRLWNSLHQNGVTICRCFDKIDDAVDAYGSKHTAQGGQLTPKGVNAHKRLGAFIGQTTVTSTASAGPMTSNGHDGGDVVKRSCVEKTPDSAVRAAGSPVTPHSIYMEAI